MAIEKITDFTPIEQFSTNKLEIINDFVPIMEGGEDTPNYLEQIIQNWDSRKEEGRETITDYQKGELSGRTGFKPLDTVIGRTQRNIQIAGKVGAGTALDVIGVGIGATLDGISWVVPDVIEDPVKNVLGSSWSWVMETEAGKEAQKALDGGVEVYSKWKNKNPQLAKTFESVVNVGLILSPYKKKVGPVQGATKDFVGPQQVQDIGSKIIYGSSGLALRTGKAKADATKFDKLETLLSPPLDKKNVLKTGPAGEPLLKESTLFRGPSMKATASESKVIEHLVRMPEIKPSKGATYNKIQIDKNQQKLNGEVSKILTQYSKGDKKISVPINVVTDNIDTSLLEALNKLTTLKGTKQVDELIDKYTKAAKEYLQKNDNTPEGVHKARVEFDRLINDEINAKVLNPESVGLTSTLAKAIRDGMNKSIDDVIPLSNSIKIRRGLQTNNYRAIDMLAIKIPKEGNRLVSLFQNLNRVNKTRASAASAAVVFGTTISNPAIWTTLAGVAGAVTLASAGPLLLKAITSPKTRKALGVTLREIDKAISITRNNAMLKQLKLDRVFITDLLQTMPSEKELEQ